ncbi:mismatch-specific DNA-glycosylase [Saccharibacillus sp. CPCC 101409]|uniref:mismatch-specific DNA-glycosylase n=1 Tax=Saccharibacillus sp. CPCC 101409 TaxID=3058041 RepID=UPI002672EFA0|nr:mismatch-specific DNA-glycosylase [Saccharibacillus sp. CPCC 101409]MDO3408307.1 mismatch-specific DNA-glycosylase [Saccharibacillus sp. CPCC 101409]
MPEIDDHLDYGLSILFIGFNPSLRSGETGHHYANPRNNFWRLLEESGITPRRYAPQEDGELLKLGYGFTNIVARPTRGVEDIAREEYREGRKILRRKLTEYRPRVACYVGKGVYTEFTGNKKADWGLQPESAVDGVVDFVAPSSSGLVRMPMRDIVSIYTQLRFFVEDELAD